MGEPKVPENAGQAPASKERVALRELILNNPTSADQRKPLSQAVEEARQARQERQERKSK